MVRRITACLATLGLLLPTTGIVQALHLAAGGAHGAPAAWTGADACCHGDTHDEAPRPARHDADRCALCHLIAVVKTALIVPAATIEATQLLVATDAPLPADIHLAAGVPTPHIPRAPPSA